MIKNLKDLRRKKSTCFNNDRRTDDIVNRFSSLQLSNRSYYISKRCGELLVRLNSTVKLLQYFASYFPSLPARSMLEQ